MKKSFLIVIAITILAAIGVNKLLKDPKFDDISEHIAFARKSNQPKLARDLWLKSVEKEPSNISNHYGYIQAHFNIPLRKKTGKRKYEYRDDAGIKIYYQELANSSNSQKADIGHYALGLIHVHLEEYKLAEDQFYYVKNEQLKYLNNSIGNLFNILGNDEVAEEYFLKAIQNRGNLVGAISNLSKLYIKHKNLGGLEGLINDKELNEYVPNSVKRKYFLSNLSFFNYIKTLILTVFGSITFIGSLGAILILCVWVVYIKKLDIYETEDWFSISLTVVLGMFFSLLTFPLSDINQGFFGFELNGGILNDFFYSVIGIGAIEEFVKIIPLLLLIRFTKYVNESYDYILYASLSALGFAFMENLLYFDQYQLHIISGRALFTSVAHMFLSSIIAYGFILSKYRYKSYTVARIVLFFVLASLGHGFYDFWLINETVGDFKFISIIFFLSGIFVWNSFKNNALNHSEFYRKDKKIKSEEVSNFLFYGLSSVMLFEYVALSIKFGPSAGNESFLNAISASAYILAFLSSSLGRFKIKKGKWLKINFWGQKKEQEFDGDPDEIIGQFIRITQFSNHEYLAYYLPNKGEVLERIDINDDASWYLVKIREKGTLAGYHPDHLFIKSKEAGETIKSKGRIMVGVFLIDEQIPISKGEFERENLEFIHWANARLDG